MTDTEFVKLRDDVNRDSIIKQRAAALWRPQDETRYQTNKMKLETEELRRWSAKSSPLKTHA